MEWNPNVYSKLASKIKIVVINNVCRGFEKVKGTIITTVAYIFQYVAEKLFPWYFA